MKKHSKYYIYCAALFLVLGSISSLTKNSDLYLSAIQNGKYFPSIYLALVLYPLTIIVGIYSFANTNKSLVALAMAFAAQIPMAISNPILFEFNTGISFNILIDKANGIGSFWHFNQAPVLGFQTEVWPNSYGINVIALLFFMGIFYILKTMPNNKFNVDSGADAPPPVN